MISQLGVPWAEELYKPADLQVLDDHSFMRKIGEFLRMRPALGIAGGKLIARPETKGKGSIALFSKKTVGDSYLLAVCNFSRNRVTEHISMTGMPGISSAMTRVIGLGTDGGNYRMQDSTVIMDLEPWEGKAVFMGDWK
jgi:hypothetical protein